MLYAFLPQVASHHCDLLLATTTYKYDTTIKHKQNAHPEKTQIIMQNLDRVQRKASDR